MSLPINTPRLFVDHPLAAGQDFAATTAQAHYLRQVMRRGAGDAVLVFNGRDGEWHAELAPQGGKGAGFKVLTQTRPQEPLPALTLAFAPVKGPRLDFIVEKATELGVGTLMPIVTARTIVSSVKEARLRAVAVEAAEQCERTTVPTITPAKRWDAFISGLSSSSETRVYFLDEDAARKGKGTSPREAMRANVPALLVVGPEGGFTPAEASALRALPSATAVSLGSRILRAETAALAALATWQVLAGDWRG